MRDGKTDRTGRSRAPVGPAAGGSLGTFAGVFTPSILTILGIILFLRVGYVVGSAGLSRALLMIAIANAISIVTSLSLSAIATNLSVKGGGDYYLISRTLGVRYGAPLGLVLFLAQSVSIAFYAIGFAEALIGFGGFAEILGVKVIAGTAVALLFVLAWLGADWATKFQYVVMVVLVAALVVFFVSGIEQFSTVQLRANLAPGNEIPFWVLFAVFFPAVTGFTQGVSMSGDLKNPARSLPLGTFAAVFLSMAVYVGVAILFAGALPNAVLHGDYNAMRRLAAVPWLIDAGVIAATLSSTMASFLGAPRILQSLAADKVFPWLNRFAVGHGPTQNPRRGVLLAAAIAYVTIGLGSLNAIAAVVSMFFLISYGLLNYATYFEARANSPSFRPRFRFFSARLSLVGALGCLGAMLAISPTAGALAIAVLFALSLYVTRTVHVERWGDSSRSRRLQRVRDDLHAIRLDLEHPRDWRPVLVAYSDYPSRRKRLVRFATWLEGGAGFTTLLRIEKARGLLGRREKARLEKELEAEIKEIGVDAFTRVVVAAEGAAAMPIVLQSFGLGRVRPNTVILNWYDRSDTAEKPALASYTDAVRSAVSLDCNVLLLAARQEDFDEVERTPSGERTIDVWYEDDATGTLALLLAYLLTRSKPFEDGTIRLLVTAHPGESEQAALDRLMAKLQEVRIDAKPEVVTRPSVEEIRRRSSEASVVFQPFTVGRESLHNALGGELDEVVKDLGITAFVTARQEIELESAPESGRHGEITAAVDAADKARRVAKQAARDADDALALVAEAESRLQAATAADPESRQKLSAEVETARKTAEDLRRRAARAQAKAESARQLADRTLQEAGIAPRREGPQNNDAT